MKDNLSMKDNLPNSKSEYMSDCLTIVTITEQNWERKKIEMDREKLGNKK